MNDFSADSADRVQLLAVDAGADGQRIDNYLLARLKGVPKSRIYRILRRGEVRVNKGRTRPDYRLKKGDIVRIPPIRVESNPDRPPAPAPGLLDRVRDSIVYEDEVLLAINKPAGLAVHGGSGLSYGVIEALRALRPEAPYLELVHRLDRATSGCLLIAKRRSALRSLHEALREGRVEKRYVALVKGHWRAAGVRVEAALTKNQLQSGERMVFVDPDGKPAVSVFSSLDSGSLASLMEVELLSGRTHQIRVHAAHAGHPVAGDQKYGDSDFNTQLKGFGLQRMALHAREIGFVHPRGGATLRIEAPLDSDMRGALRTLGLRYDEQL